MEPDPDAKKSEDFKEVLKELEKDVDKLYNFRDLFFEDHDIEMASEKNRLVEEKMNLLIKKFEDLDENEIPMSCRAQYLYMKGRTYNITTSYDHRASQCLSKAVKLNPRLVDAWNELGECYWKNLNVKEAKSSFEGALKQERNKVALRCLSIILRQEATHSSLSPAQYQKTVLESVELAREAVNKDPTDGNCWSVLGNAQLCRYFMISQQPETLKAAMSAYKQAARDKVTRGMPDLYYNSGVGLKYDEQYSEALTNFEVACRLDPAWEVPRQEQRRLLEYLAKVHDLVKTKGKLKTKKIQAMVQAIDKRHIEPHTALQCCPLAELCDGENARTMLVGKVVGSVHSDHKVPFTFALVDASLACAAVTVYNWADGRGVIIGDSVALPQPVTRTCHVTHGDTEYKFRSIRVNNPTTLLVNGKKIGSNQIAGTRVTSTYEIH